jgi:hypothetical protein
MEPANLQLGPKDSVDLCIMMYGLHVMLNAKCTSNIHMDILHQI